MEATSHYHYRMADSLHDAGFEVSVINPLITKKFSRSAIRKTKTDKVDAELLSTIGLQEPNLPCFMETKEHRVKKQYAKQIASLKTERRKLTQRRNQMRGVSEVLDDGCASLIASLERKIRLCNQEVHLLGMELHAMTKKETGVIASIPGVGALTASCIAAELGDLSRFQDRDQVVAFAGLDPSRHESGSSVRGRSRITKRGSSTLRGFLGQAAWGVMIHNPRFKTYYLKKKQEGKHYFSILVAMAKKLLLIIYGMLKSGTLFDPSRGIAPPLVT